MNRACGKLLLVGVLAGLFCALIGCDSSDSGSGTKKENEPKGEKVKVEEKYGITTESAGG